MTAEKKKQALINVTFVGFWLIRTLCKSTLDITGKFGGGFNIHMVLFLIFTIALPVLILFFYHKDSSSDEEKLPFLMWLIIDPYLFRNATLLTSSFAAILTLISLKMLKSDVKKALVPVYISILLISAVYPAGIYSFIMLLCIAIFAGSRESSAGSRIVTAFAIPLVIFAVVTAVIGIVTGKHVASLDYLREYSVYRFIDIFHISGIRYIIPQVVIYIIAIALFIVICKKYLSEKLGSDDYAVIFVPIVMSFIGVAFISAGFASVDTALFFILLTFSLFGGKNTGTALYNFFVKHKIVLLVLIALAIFAFSSSYDSKFLGGLSESYM